MAAVMTTMMAVTVTVAVMTAMVAVTVMTAMMTVTMMTTVMAVAVMVDNNVVCRDHHDGLMMHRHSAVHRLCVAVMHRLCVAHMHWLCIAVLHRNDSRVQCHWLLHGDNARVHSSLIHLFCFIIILRNKILTGFWGFGVLPSSESTLQALRPSHVSGTLTAIFGGCSAK